MMSTALNLSPQILSLGDTLITKLTGFTENEENFEICHDFVVSNLLYHTYLEPHERDVQKKCEKLAEKWSIQNKSDKATRFEQLLEQYFDAEVFKEGTVFKLKKRQNSSPINLYLNIITMPNSYFK